MVSLVLKDLRNTYRERALLDTSFNLKVEIYIGITVYECQRRFTKTAERRGEIMKSISIYDLRGDLVRTFASIADTAKYLEVAVGTIDRAVVGAVHNCKGYIVAYSGEDVAERVIKADKSVTIYDKQGHFISKFPSIAAAAVATEESDDKLRYALAAGKPSGTKGLYVILTTDPKDIRDLLKSNLPSIMQLSYRGELINTYKTQAAAAKAVNGIRQGISTATTSPGKRYLGYLWAVDEKSATKTVAALRERAMRSNKQSKLYKLFFGGSDGR